MVNNNINMDTQVYTLKEKKELEKHKKYE